MKLLLCGCCGDLQALQYDRRECRCGRSAGCYDNGGDTATVAGEAMVVGIDNRTIYSLVVEGVGARGDVWRYDESNGKITRFVNPADIG